MSEQYLLQIIKRAAVEAVDAAKPMKITFGKVEHIAPLKIRIEERIIIDDAFLIKTEAAVDKLKAGDKAVLLCMQGGQQYLFIDRVVD